MATTILKRCNDPAIIERCIALNYEAWGPPLTLEQYLKRDAFLAKREFAKNSLQTWILVDESENLLCACETYTRPCIGYSAIAKKVTLGNCMSVASVFTRKENRGKGYAGMMVTKLQEKMKETDNVFASTLYSEVGSDFYGKLGWTAATCKSLISDIDLKTEVPSHVKDDDHISWLFLEDVKPIIQKENEDLQAYFNTLPSKDHNKNTFSLLPTYEAQDWLLARSEFHLTVIKGEKLDKPLHSGVSWKGGDFVIWIYDYRSSTLKITLAKITSKEAAHAILSACKAEARRIGLTRIESWDPSSELEDWAKDHHLQEGVNEKWRVESRGPEDSISSLCFWEENGRNRRGVEWIKNEKFAWV